MHEFLLSKQVRERALLLVQPEKAINSINEHVALYHNRISLSSRPISTLLTCAVMMAVVSLTSTLDVLLIVSSLVAFLAIRGYQRRRGLAYPPGPRPLPLIGNFLDIPKEFSWLSYTQLSEKHGMIYFEVKGLLTECISGDVLSFHVFGKVIVVLNSIKATKNLFERRGEIGRAHV